MYRKRLQKRGVSPGSAKYGGAYPKVRGCVPQSTGVGFTSLNQPSAPLKAVSVRKETVIPADFEVNHRRK